MTFQIFDSETNNPIFLQDFDSLYWMFLNKKEDPNNYGRWFMLLEAILNMYGDIADNCKDSYLYKSLKIKDSRTLSLHQAAQVLIMWYGRTFLKGDTFEGIEYIKDVVNFFQHYDNQYYIEFSF